MDRRGQEPWGNYATVIYNRIIMSDNRKIIRYSHCPNANGFSLLEIMAVLTIVAMVAISALAVFNRARRASASISDRLNRSDTSMEVLQRIAEDLDRLVKPGYDIKVTIANKIENRFPKSQLTIESKIYDKDSKPVIFEKVIWQSQYDEFEESQVLYRAHFGINLDDKILSIEEAQKEEIDRRPFVPVCTGMTLFEFTIPREPLPNQPQREPLQQWTGNSPPPAITVLMSFLPPTELATGEFVFLEEDVEMRTIAIDRTRKIRFVFVKKEYKIEDPNDASEQPTDPNEPAKTAKGSDPADTDEPKSTSSSKRK